MPNRLSPFLNPETVLVFAVILLAGVAHGLNMFNYPYYENDEGTYMSQAWSLATQSRLAPYTYTYDHAPGGWILIALWSALTGFFTFGSSINSGRVLMLLLHLFSSLFIYLISRKLTDNPFVSALAVLVFSLSPLAIYFHRRVLLDNIMVFWTLFSLYLLLLSPRRIGLLIFSALLMGIAVITKENAIFFVPGFLYFVNLLNQNRRTSSLISWLLIFSLPPLIYLSYALIRGELFPYGSALGGSSPHVSLISTLTAQLNREGAPFWPAFQHWFRTDPILIILGLLATIINIILSRRDLIIRGIILFSIFFIIYLFQGLVLEFYILPLIPFFAINIALALSYLLSRWSSNNYQHPSVLISTGLLFVFMIIDLFYFGSRTQARYSLYTSNQTSPQNQAVAWILSQHQPDVFYVIDNYAYVDLHARRSDHFKYAHYYWKVDMDPAISQGILNQNWRYISYLTLTPQMEGDLSNPINGLTLVNTARKNSSLLKDFYSDGWSVKIMKVNR